MADHLFTVTVEVPHAGGAGPLPSSASTSPPRWSRPSSPPTWSPRSAAAVKGSYFASPSPSGPAGSARRSPSHGKRSRPRAMPAGSACLAATAKAGPAPSRTLNAAA